jgi:hypothetical protein
MKFQAPQKNRIPINICCAFLLLSAITFGATSAFACKCAMPPPTAKQALKSATAVFAGKVLEINESGSSNIVLMQIENSWKGVEESVVTFETGRNSASCGYTFSPGERYLVYADADGSQGLHTSRCARTTALKNAGEDLAILGKGTPRRAEIYIGSQTMRFLLFVVAVLTVVVLFLAYGKKGREKMQPPRSHETI